MSMTTLATRPVFESRWLKLREDVICLGDGSTSTYAVVEKADSAFIAPVQDGRIYLVEQFRYPVSGRYWELPQGSWPDAPGKEPLELAKAELREETGLSAAEMVPIGHLFEACGYSNQGVHVFFATGLSQGPQDLEPEESDLICRSFTFAEVRQLIDDGLIKDATTMAAFGLLQIKGLLSF